MLGSQPPLRGAALLFSLSLLTQGRLQAAAPLPPAEDARPQAPSPAPPAKEVRARALPPAQPLPSREGGDAREEEDDELFPGVDPEALAAVLLQALDGTGHNSPDKRRAPDEERVRSQSRSGSLGAGRAGGQEEGGGDSAPPQLADLQAIVQELRAFSPAAKRERPRGDPAPGPGPGPGEVLRELEEFGRLRAGTKRRAPPAEPWAGARKLRRQQQLEHQLLQRRYEELAESRRQAQEARQAAAEEERLADLASDLLLQYLLKGREAEGAAGADAREEEDEEAEEEEEEAAGAFRGGRAKGSPLLFEDEEGNVAEDKRSDELRAGEDEEEALDPGTIDQLIELSSQLHLPAQDVIDIVSDVGKQRKEAAAAAQGPPYAAPWRRPAPDEPDWNEVLRGGEAPAPRRSPARQSHVSNYIQPRAFQPAPAPAPAHPRSRPPPGRREEEAASRARDEELENYIEQLLLGRAQTFQ